MNGKLREMFPSQTHLSPADVARCLEMSALHIFHLLLADPMPLPLRARGADRQLSVKLDDLADYLSTPAPNNLLQALTPSRRSSLAKMKEALFRAELRAEVYQSKFFGMMEQVIILVDKFQIDPESADERCLSGLQLSKIVLKAEAKTLLCQLWDFIVSTSQRSSQTRNPKKSLIEMKG